MEIKAWGEVFMLRKSRVSAPKLICLALVLMLWTNIALANKPYTDAVELEAFLDGVMTTLLEQYRIPGGVIAVVHDDRVLLAKDYGYADLEEDARVTPDTLFRAGSISKLFVWTAVMQLYERGLLALDQDVSTYLDFESPGTEPIAMEHLMAHTAGFEDKNIGTIVLAEKDLQPLGEYLANSVPARVFPPGQVSAYSNYGCALAAYIVERITGKPFHEYVEEHIFIPLGMQSSTFRQPVPEPLAQRLAAGYRYTEGRYLLGSFEFCQLYPAGSLSTSASDMAKFMLAHLSGGPGGQNILSPESRQLMHSQSFAHHPELPGMAHGFIEMQMNGRRIIAHGGDTFLFHSGLYLLPDEQLGVFTAFNGADASAASDSVFKAFMGRYFGDESKAGPSEDLLERSKQLSGRFHVSRSNYTEMEAVLRLLNPIRIYVDQDGYLVVDGGSLTNRFVPTESGVFQSIDGGSQLYPVTDSTGRVTRYYTSFPVTFLRTPWYAAAEFALFVGGLSLLVYLGTAVRWIALLVKRQASRISLARPAVIVVSSLALAQISFYLLVFFLLGNIHPVFGIPMAALVFTPWMGYVRLVSWVYALLTASLTLIALNQIRKRTGYLKPLSYAVLSQGFVFLLYYWNFL